MERYMRYIKDLGCFSRNTPIDEDDEAFCIHGLKQMLISCKKEGTSQNCLAYIVDILNKDANSSRK